MRNEKLELIKLDKAIKYLNADISVGKLFTDSVEAHHFVEKSVRCLNQTCALFPTDEEIKRMCDYINHLFESKEMTQLFLPISTMILSDNKRHLLIAWIVTDVPKDQLDRDYKEWCEVNKK